MAATAILKIITAESPLIIMTTGTTLNISRRKMHCRQRCPDLIAARGTGFDAVASGAVQRPVPLMAEIYGERLRIDTDSSRRPAGLMADIARRHGMRGLRRMTLKTGRVGVGTGRNGQRNAGSGRSVAGRATCIAQMFGVVELDIETLQRRKSLHRAGFGIGMTNRADRVGVVLKLLDMTADAGRMSCLTGKTDPGGIGITAMTDQTRQLCMILV